MNSKLTLGRVAPGLQPKSTSSESLGVQAVRWLSERGHPKSMHDILRLLTGDGCCYQMGVLFVGVHMIRPLLFWGLYLGPYAYIRCHDRLGRTACISIAPSCGSFPQPNFGNKSLEVDIHVLARVCPSARTSC